MLFGSSFLPPEQVNRLKQVSITVCNSQKIILWLAYYCFTAPLEVEYTKKGSEITVASKNLSASLENTDLASVFCQDLRDVLAHRKAVIQEFRIAIEGFDSDEIGTQIIDFLGTTPDKIEIKTFSMDVTGQDQYFKILPILEAKTL